MAVRLGGSVWTKYAEAIKTDYKQLLFVCAAFLLMVIVSTLYVGMIMRNNLVDSVNETMRAVEGSIRTNLHEPEATLVWAAFAIKKIAAENREPVYNILAYMTELSKWFTRSEDRVSGFNGIFGVIGGEYLDGMRWVPPLGYIPSERPWYIAAAEAKGEIAFTDPYIDAETHRPVISFSQELYDDNEKKIGIIAIDVILSMITSNVYSMRLASGGHGVLLNSKMEIMIHSNEKLLGIQMDTISEELNGIAAELGAGGSISARTITSMSDEKTVLFMRPIYNGWYLGVLIPVSSYYSGVKRMTIILALLGGASMLALCGFLIRLSVERTRSHEKAQSKSAYLARMSHEIRTPMNAIIGMSELAEMNYASERGLEYISGIKQAGNDLLSIINDILDISNIETGNIQITRESYDMASLLNDTVAIIRAKIGDKPIELIAEINPNIPGTLIGDETRVRQILLNLLSNAAKYTDYGFIKFNADFGYEDDGAVNLMFIVEDSGIGIREEDLPELFGDFVRLDILRRKGVESTGLGLVITRSLCRAMGGDVTVSSKYGCGSTFAATITQKDAGARALGSLGERLSQRDGEHKPVAFTAPGFKVLLVDDVETNLNVAEGLLAPYKMNIAKCGGGREAVNLVRIKKFDLVLMDHMMPGMDGIEAVKAIRALGGRAEGLPIIALTANALAGMRQVFLENGFNDFLPKPIEVPKLRKMMEKWVPHEKRAAAENDSETEESAKDTFHHIEGIDTAKGLSMCGSASRYRDTLEVFCRDAESRVRFFEDVPDDDEMDIFAIQSHALKSASANIGAGNLSAVSALLEEAARERDAVTIKKYIGGFLAQLTTVIKNIHDALAKERERENSADSAPNEEVISLLNELKKNIDAVVVANRAGQRNDAQNIDAIDEILEKLYDKPLDARTRDAVSKISDLMLMSEFDDAKIRLDKLL